MGIGYTLQQLEGWQGQYNRMIRWHARVVAAANADASPDELDFLLTFFENCFHLREWLLVTLAADQKSLDELFLSRFELRVCRDLANGFKHHTINRPSVDARFSVVNEYAPSNWPSGHAYPNGKWTVLAGGHQLGLVDLASQCVGIWQDFLRSSALI